VDKFIAITLTSFQETLRRRVFYIVLFLAIILIASITSQMFFLRMARQAGEVKMLTGLGVQIVQQILGIWSFAGLFLALFLGAIGISSEISTRTIVHVLSRPVERWVYILGRWSGTLIFLWGFLFVGIFAALLVAFWLSVPYTPVLWVSFAEMYVTLTFFSGVALGFSVLMPPVLAGSASLLLAMLPSIAHGATHHPSWAYRIPALIAYYIGPAKMPVDLVEESFSKAQLHTDYWLFFRVLGENLFYVIAILILATALFRRREIRFP
jgi:ABC-type transport system involved in multi-copper enzyme maturation permease subunit